MGTRGTLSGASSEWDRSLEGGGGHLASLKMFFINHRLDVRLRLRTTKAHYQNWSHYRSEGMLKQVYKENMERVLLLTIKNQGKGL